MAPVGGRKNFSKKIMKEEMGEKLATARGERDFEPFELIENSKTEHMNLEKKKKNRYNDT